MRINDKTKTIALKRKKADRIYQLLLLNYPSAKIILNYSNFWELLAAVILSAQCTDKMVNKITAKLFLKYPKIEDYVKADLVEFETDIKQAGFYRHKAKNILSSAKIISERWSGEVPAEMKALLTLPGIARKSANVILGNAYHKIEGIAVDTHVLRLSQRLGFSSNKNPVKVERDLMQLFPQKYWFKLTYLLIDHGRALCKAPKPLCAGCFLNKLCPSAFSF